MLKWTREFSPKVSGMFKHVDTKTRVRVKVSSKSTTTIREQPRGCTPLIECVQGEDAKGFLSQAIVRDVAKSWKGKS